MFMNVKFFLKKKKEKKKDQRDKDKLIQNPCMQEIINK